MEHGELRQTLRESSRGTLLECLADLDVAASGRVCLDAVDELSPTEPGRALSILDGLARSKALRRDVSARQAILAFTQPGEQAVHDVLHGEARPSALGRAYRREKGEGRARAFVITLGRGLSTARLDSLVVSLCKGEFEARRLAGALMLVREQVEVPVELSRRLIQLALDPLPAVWSQASAALGIHASAGSLLGDWLDGALSGSLRETATWLAQGERRGIVDSSSSDPSEPVAETVVHERSRASNGGASLEVGLAFRRATAALGGLAARDPGRVVTLLGGASSAALTSWRGLLGERSRDVWTRASACLGLHAWAGRDEPLSQLTAVRASPQLPVLANLAGVLADRSPEKAGEFVADLREALLAVRPGREAGLWLDAVASLRDLPPAGEALATATGDAEVDAWLSVRDRLSGRRRDVNPTSAGCLRVLCCVDLLRHSRYVGSLARRIKGAADLPEAPVRAIEERKQALADVAAAMGIGEGERRLSAAVREPLLESLASLVEAIQEAGHGRTGSAAKRQATRELWVFRRALRHPVEVDPEGLPRRLCDLKEDLRAPELLRVLIERAGEALSAPEERAAVELLSAALEVAGSSRGLGVAAAKRVPDLLRARCFHDEPPRAVMRPLARLAAAALDACTAEAESSARRDDLAVALMEHGWFSAGLGRLVREAVRTCESVQSLAASERGGDFERGLADVAEAIGRGLAPDPPGTIDGFRIVRELGRGAFGTVFECHSSRHGRVAVKACQHASGAVGREFQRFLDEAVMIARLNHPAIPSLHAIGHHQGYPYIAMELIVGKTLKEAHSDGSIDTTRAWGLLLELAEVLDYAHEQKVIHRDLKPANLMVAEDGTLRVLDWGLAHAATVTPLDAGRPGGTRMYSAPEQFGASACDSGRLADFFACGRIAMEVLTGELISTLVSRSDVDDPSRPEVSAMVLHEAGVDGEAAKCLLALTDPLPGKRKGALGRFALLCEKRLIGE